MLHSGPDGRGGAAPAARARGPVLACRARSYSRLGVGAGGYGVLFAALGVGAITGALVLGRVRRTLSTNATLSVAGAILAAALALLVLVPSFAVALVVLVFAGLAWTGTISTLVAELQLFLPRWVMARGMAIWTMISPAVRRSARWPGGWSRNRPDSR